MHITGLSWLIADGKIICYWRMEGIGTAGVRASEPGNAADGIAVSYTHLDVYKRQALTILDQCCSFSSEIDEELVSQVLGYAGYTALYALIAAMAEYDERSALAQLTAILDGGIEAGILVGQMLECFHKMLLEAVSGAEEQSPLWQAGGKMGKKTLLRGVEIFSAAQANIRFAAKPEKMCIRDSPLNRLRRSARRR